MTQDHREEIIPSRTDVLRMAREAGFTPNSSYTVLPMKDYTSHGISYELERFYQTAFEAGAAHEREACAKVCADNALESINGIEQSSMRKCAAAIRARSNQ